MKTLEEYVLESGFSIDELPCYDEDTGKELADPCEYFNADVSEIYVYEEFHEWIPGPVSLIVGLD